MGRGIPQKAKKVKVLEEKLNRDANLGSLEKGKEAFAKTFHEIHNDPTKTTAEKQTFLNTLTLEYAKSALLPQYITHQQPTSNIVELARIVRVIQEKGFVDGADVMNFDAMEEAMRVPLKYKSGPSKTLLETFGLLDRSVSTTDFAVFIKPGEEYPTVVFRGSRTDFTKKQTAKDWAYNALSSSEKTKAIAERLPSIKKIDRDVQKVFDKYGGLQKTGGYSKGGGLAFKYAEQYSCPSILLNPHINATQNLANPTQEHLVARTAEDPATMWLALKKIDRSKIDIRTFPTLQRNDNAYLAHGEDNFWDDMSARNKNSKIVGRLNGNAKMRELDKEIRNAEVILRNKHKSLSEVLDILRDPYEKLVRPKVDEAKARVGREIELQGSRLYNRVRGVDNFNTPETVTNPSPLIRSNTRSYFSANDEFGDFTRHMSQADFENIRVGSPNDTSSQSSFNSDIVDKYMKLPQKQRAQLSNQLQLQIKNRANALYHDYISPSNDFTRTMLSEVLASARVRTFGGGLALGFGVGYGIDQLFHKFGFDTSHPIVAGAMNGAITGAITESAILKITTGAIFSSIGDVVQIGSSALSGGVGIVVGIAATQAIQNMFSADANPYTKYITSNVVGGEIGFASGVAVSYGASYIAAALTASTTEAAAEAALAAAAAGGIEMTEIGIGSALLGAEVAEVGLGAGLGAGVVAAEVGAGAAITAAAATEAEIAAVNWWNPVGWALGIGALITLGVGIGVGVATANAEEAAKEAAKQANEQAKKQFELETAEANYAGSAIMLRAQFGDMRTFLEEMGMSPTTIAQLNKDMLERLRDERVKPLTQAEYESVFQSYLIQFSFGNHYNGNFQNDTFNNLRDVREVMAQQYNAHQTVLRGLVEELASKGVKIQMPPPAIMDAQMFALTYNAMLKYAPQSVINELGIGYMKVAPNANEPSLASSVPSRFDADKTLAYEAKILEGVKSGMPLQDFFKLHTDDLPDPTGGTLLSGPKSIDLPDFLELKENNDIKTQDLAEQKKEQSVIPNEYYLRYGKWFDSKTNQFVVDKGVIAYLEANPPSKRPQIKSSETQITFLPQIEDDPLATGLSTSDSTSIKLTERQQQSLDWANGLLPGSRAENSK